ILGGSSFGGMVALELAAIVRPKCVILIGSARSPTGLVRFPGMARALAKALPAWLLRPRREMMGLISGRFGTLSPEQRELFWAMAATKSGWFIKWGISAILSWRPTEVAAQIHQIHGSADHVIPLRLVTADRVVAGGGHLLSITHAPEVLAYIAE